MSISARGFGTGYVGVSQGLLTIIIVFLGIAIYNVVELHCIIFGSFRRHTGLYFWAFLCATWGIGLYCIGFLIKFFVPPSLGYLACTTILIGWIGMITGQSLVLWSRLHLIVWNKKVLRIMFWIIIVDATLITITITPMFYGSFSKNPEIWKVPYIYMEKVEVTTYFLQETMLSSFYILEAVRLIRLERALGNTLLYRRFMIHLILINIMVILLDMTIIFLEFTNQYNVQTSYKPFVYSVKLKLEFTVLNRLVEVTRSRSKDPSSARSRDCNPVHHAVDLEGCIGDMSGKPAGVPGVTYQVCTIGGTGGPNRVQHTTDTDLLQTRDNGSPTRNANETVDMTGVTVDHEEEEEGKGKDEEVRRSIGQTSAADMTVSCTPAIIHDTSHDTSHDAMPEHDLERGRSTEPAMAEKNLCDTQEGGSTGD